MGAPPKNDFRELKNTEDQLHKANIATKNMFKREYYVIHHAQQNKYKVHHCLDLINITASLWIYDTIVKKYR